MASLGADAEQPGRVAWHLIRKSGGHRLGSVPTEAPAEQSRLWVGDSNFRLLGRVGCFHYAQAN